MTEYEKILRARSDSRALTDMTEEYRAVIDSSVYKVCKHKPDDVEEIGRLSKEAFKEAVFDYEPSMGSFSRYADGVIRDRLEAVLLKEKTEADKIKTVEETQKDKEKKADGRNRKAFLIVLAAALLLALFGGLSGQCFLSGILYGSL